MKPVFEYRRVRAYPGKHPNGDLRVEFSGGAPTHGELAALCALVCMAEDRYEKTGGKGRPYFKENVWDPAYLAGGFEDVARLAARIDKKQNKVLC